MLSLSQVRQSRGARSKKPFLISLSQEDSNKVEASVPESNTTITLNV